MKKLIVVICALVLVVGVILVSGRGSGENVPVRSVSEAAFALRNSGSEDATSFLVGKFSGGEGMSLSFDGRGEVRRTDASLATEIGRCNLTQAENGTALLATEFSGESRLYAFAVASPEGGFVLTDEAGESVTYLPVP